MEEVTKCDVANLPPAERSDAGRRFGFLADQKIIRGGGLCRRSRPR